MDRQHYNLRVVVRTHVRSVVDRSGEMKLCSFISVKTGVKCLEPATTSRLDKYVNLAGADEYRSWPMCEQHKDSR